MKPRRPRRRSPQPTLFDPPVTIPCWETMPDEIRQVALALLVQLLRQHPLPRERGAREVRDE